MERDVPWRRPPVVFLLPFFLTACALTPLQKAAMRGDAEEVRGLLDGGADVNKPNLWTNSFPLIDAAKAGHLEVVKMLLDDKADINARDLKGRSALMAAAAGGHAGVVEELLNRGSLVMTSDDKGTTPLMYASKSGNKEAVRLIKQAQDKAKSEASKEAVWTPGGGYAAPAAQAAAKKEPEAPSIVSDVDHPRFKLPERPNDFALVIGIEKYSGMVEAQFAERDAKAMRENLLALGYPARNILFLTNGQAGRASIEKYVESWLPRNVSEDSRVFVYFSGHGSPEPTTGDAYLVPWDGDAKFLENTGYSVKRLYSKLNALKAKQVIVAMDACFSGAGGRSVIAKGTRPLVLKLDSGANVIGEKLVVFSASGADEVTGTDETQGHGLFTYYFLKGLSGAAKGSGGTVSVESLYNYLSPKVADAARRQNRDQSPQLMPLNMDESRKSMPLR
ncbi:MAG: ankyrin repeat domain-containing protein [Elusimicrobiota bacterium]